MQWHPSFGSVDAREPWYCVQTDRTYSSYRELDKASKASGRVVLGKRDYDRFRRESSAEERLQKTGIRKLVREDMERTVYRVKHGYQKLDPQTNTYVEKLG